MDARDPTANNAELWAHYLRKQWATALDPFGVFRSESGYLVGRQFTDAVAATVASLTAAFLGPMVASLYESNARFDTATLPDRDAPVRAEIPPEFAVSPPPAASTTPASAPPPSTQIEDWRGSAPQEATLAG